MKKGVEFAFHLKNLRKENKLTQKEIAMELMISPQAVSRWEHGQGRPDLEMLPKLAAILKIDVNTLLGYHSEMSRVTQYEDIYKQEEYYWGYDIQEIAREVLRLMPPIRPIRILEIGCGEGQAAVFFARNGYIVSAFDIAEAGIAKGKKLAESVGVEVNFFRADLLKYHIEQEYDVIYASNILQYIPPAKRSYIMSEIKEHTAINGLNVCNTFVKKNFIDTAPDWENSEYYWDTAELFVQYDENWKFELMKEECINSNSAGIAHKHCVDVMIARKVVTPPPIKFHYNLNWWYRFKVWR